MAHIAYNNRLPFGTLTASVITRLISTRQDVDRLINVANSLTNGGANPELLESGDGQAAFGIPAGQGATFYGFLQSIQSGLNAISASTIADLDLG